MLTRLKLMWYRNLESYLLYISTFLIVTSAIIVIMFKNYFPNGLNVNNVFTIKSVDVVLIILIIVPIMVFISYRLFNRMYEKYISPTKMGFYNDKLDRSPNTLYYIIDSSDELFMNRSEYLFKILDSVKTLLIKSKLYDDVTYVDVTNQTLWSYNHDDLTCDNFVAFGYCDAKMLGNVQRLIWSSYLDNETENKIIWNIASSIAMTTIYKRRRIRYGTLFL